MSGSRFAFLLTMTILAVVLMRVVVPIVIYSTDICTGSGGGCGALALVVGTFGGLATVALFVVAMIAIFYRRIRTAGLSRLWMLIVVLFVWESNRFVYGAGNFWAANFSAGLIFMQVPYMLIALVGFGVFLSLYVPTVADEVPVGHLRAWKVAAFSAGAIWATGSLGASFVLAHLAARAGWPVQLVLPVSSLILFLSALTYLLIASTDRGSAPPGTSSQPRTPSLGLPGRPQFGRRSS